ncbi:hypothetical protein KBD75_01595 [Candidatus Woesebacteria bacterium]|nr:hypothetical protein [Candidatus Woesebacteria bacterium]
MATTLTPNEKKALILRELSRHGGGDYSLVNQYLKLVSSNRNIDIAIDGDSISFSPQELWNIVGAWCREELNLSIGDRGNFVTLSLRALDAIDRKVRGETIAASAKYELIKKQTENPIVAASAPTDPTGDVFKKSLALQREQIAMIESTFLGKLRKNLTDSPIFKNADPRTRAEMLQMVAYANHNFRTTSQFTPDDLNQLLNIEAGKGQINKETHRLYSTASKGDFTKMVAVINNTINDVYSENEAKYEKDMATLRTVADLSPNISDVDWMIEKTVAHGTAEEKGRLAWAIRSELINSAKTGHVSGEDIISRALTKSGLSSATQNQLAPLSPYLETIRIDESSKLQGSSLKESKKKGLLATLNLTTALGVSTDAPWQNFNDLKSAQDAITDRYGVNTLVEAYGKTNDLGELREIRNLMGAMSDHTRYHEGLRGSVLYSVQDAWDKTWNRSADGVAKFSLLDPFAGITKRWTGFQTNIAINVHDWAINVDGASWFSGFARNVGDFTEGFIKHEADWTSAGHFFVERKWGNVLDWAAKMAGYETMDAAKAAFWQGTIKAIEVGGNKLAAGLGSKLATTLAGLATSAEGIGLVILGLQLGWEAVKFGYNKIKQFFNDSEFRDKVLNWLPITLGLGLAAMATMPALMLAGIVGASSALLGILLAAVASLATLFIAAGGWMLGILLMIFIFTSFGNATIKTDAGLGTFIANVVCDDSGNTTIPGTTSQNTAPAPSTSGGGILARAVCLAKYLNQCYGPSVNVNNVAKGISCLTTYAIAPSAIEDINFSASNFVNLQCVGFVKASMRWAGKDLGYGHACQHVSDANFVAGLGGVKPGDAIIFRSSGVCGTDAPGHIGIFKEDAGANICLIDANQQCPGCVVDGNCLPKTDVAGYLKL